MKRLLAACLIIFLLVGTSCLHVGHLEALTAELTDRLETVRSRLSREDWDGAQRAMEQVCTQWEERSFYLHITLRHTEIDAIRASMKEITAYLRSREDRAECLAVLARLVNQLELLLEAEQLTVKNIL